ncbi:hypothetical protein C0J52_01591 [Blattella germanica]|nr:hypothetical protein C0J52_01591 [Blattella germanica]
MSEENSVLKCKRCKSKTVNGCKCRVCSSIFHPSCAKLHNNIIFISEDTVICCEQDNGNDLIQATADGFQLQEGEINYILKLKFLMKR